jgi:lipoate-protein ligase B
MLEEVIIRTLARYDISGTRDDINTGVWAGRNKVAAVGISTSRWVTTHGFALNVDPDLSYFDTSVLLPCGIEGRGVTSMAEILKARGVRVTDIPTVQQVADVVTEVMEEVFDVKTLVTTVSNTVI